jgi:hypothetical protein
MDQMYFREKARRHNRMLHGWGIVCGAEVRVSKQPGCVDVNTGYVLGPYGDEILIEDIVTVDLSACNGDGDAANGCVPPDPWCAEVKVAPTGDQPVYVAISYAEFPCSPVQVATSGCGCGCEETACEYSRLRDSYRIRVLDTLPDSYAAKMVPPSVVTAVSCSSDYAPAVHAVQQLFYKLPDPPPDPVTPPDPKFCDCPQCGPCPSSPWVILAAITVNGDTITIDCDSYRRYVASFRDFFYMCQHRDPKEQPDFKKLFNPAALKALAAKPANLAAVIAAQPAKNLLVSVVAASHLGKKLAPLTVADSAVIPRDTVVANMAAGVAAAQRAGVAAKAGQIWEKAVAAKNLGEGRL